MSEGGGVPGTSGNQRGTPGSGQAASRGTKGFRSDGRNTDVPPSYRRAVAAGDSDSANAASSADPNAIATSRLRGPTSSSSLSASSRHRPWLSLLSGFHGP